MQIPATPENKPYPMSNKDRQAAALSKMANSGQSVTPSSGRDVAHLKKRHAEKDDHDCAKSIGNAAKWVSIFKVGSSLAMAGLVNSVLFESGLPAALVLAGLTTLTQTSIALKIHKEDTELSRDITKLTRKMMGREHDKSAAGKEWSMVPVWGVTCGMVSLLESSSNALYAKHFRKDEKKTTLQERFEILEKKLPTRTRFQSFYKFHLQEIRLALRAKESGTKFILESLPKFLPRKLKHLPAQMLKKMESNVQGNAKLGFALVFAASMLGAVLQSVFAAVMLQKRVDAKNKDAQSQHHLQKSHDPKPIHHKTKADPSNHKAKERPNTFSTHDSTLTTHSKSSTSSTTSTHASTVAQGESQHTPPSSTTSNTKKSEKTDTPQKKEISPASLKPKHDAAPPEQTSRPSQPEPSSQPAQSTPNNQENRPAQIIAQNPTQTVIVPPSVGANQAQPNVSPQPPGPIPLPGPIDIKPNPFGQLQPPTIAS